MPIDKRTDQHNILWTADPDYQVTESGLESRSFIEKLQRYYSAEVGFVPNSIMCDKLQRGNYHLITVRGQEAGFALVTTGSRKPLHIVQHAVSEELWLQGYGTALIQQIATRAARAAHKGITITVRDDIPTHGFWLAIGAKQIRTRFGGSTRKKMLIDYAIAPAQVVRLSQLQKAG